MYDRDPFGRDDHLGDPSLPDGPEPSDDELSVDDDAAAVARIEDALAETGAYDDDAVTDDDIATWWDAQRGAEETRSILADPDAMYAIAEAERDLDGQVVVAEIVDEFSSVETAEFSIEPVGFDDRVIPLSSVTTLRRGLLALDDDRKTLAERGDVDGLAYGVADLALVLEDLRALDRSARTDIAQIMLARHATETDKNGKPKKGNPKHEVPGLGIIDVPGGNEWKGWESEKLLRKLMTDAILDDDGELLHFDHPREVVDRVYDVIVKCLPVTGSLGWRVGQFDKATEEWSGLRGQGIDPEDYAEHTPKPRLAVVPKRNPAEGVGS